MEQLTPVGITVSAGNITGIGGTVGTVDNAVPRADGTGGFTVQGSDIVIDDPATGVNGNNIALRNDHSGQTNSSLVLTPKGTGAFIRGAKPDGTTTGGNARGDHATDFQTLRTAASEVASGTRAAILGGQQNTCSGNRSFIGAGEANTVSERNSAIASGLTNSTGTSQRSFIGCGESNSTTANNTGILSGHHARADRLAMQSHASGQFAANGDAQRARFVMRCKTTTNAAVELFLDGSSTRLTIPSGKYVTGTINIAGIKSDGATAARYIRQFSIKNVAATTSLVGTVDTIGVDQAASTSISITADDTNDSLKVEVTGIASETWRWVAAVDVVEVAYGT